MPIIRKVLQARIAEEKNKNEHIERRRQEIRQQNMALVPEIKRYILEFLKANCEHMFQHVEIYQAFEWDGTIRRRHRIPLWDSREGTLLWESESGLYATHANVVDLIRDCLAKAIAELIDEGKVETIEAEGNCYYGLKS